MYNNSGSHFVSVTKKLWKELQIFCYRLSVLQRIKKRARVMLISTNTSLRDLRKSSLETHGALTSSGN